MNPQTDLLMSMTIGARYTRAELENRSAPGVVSALVRSEAVVFSGFKRCPVTGRAACSFTLALIDGA